MSRPKRNDCWKHRHRSPNRRWQTILRFETLEDRVVPALDFGDAPAPFASLLADDGARHEAIGPTLGAARDMEADGLPSANAAGDDTNGASPDDEDGVTFGSIRVGQSEAVAVVNVQNAPSDARLDAWIDFNGDGDWDDPGEQIATDLTVSEGDNAVLFDVPIDAVAGDTFARFRLSTAGNLAPTGLAADGEVEDDQVTIIDIDAFAFDMLQSGSRNLNSFTITPPAPLTVVSDPLPRVDFTSTDSGFGKYQRGVAPTIPASLLDDSDAGEPLDTRGIITDQNTDTFFGVVDTDEGGLHTGDFVASWTFDVSMLDPTAGVEVAVDMGALGDFEPGTDFFEWTYSFSNASGGGTLFSSQTQSAGSQTITMAGGEFFTLFNHDPIFVDGTLLGNELQTFRTALIGSGGGVGDELTITLTARNDDIEDLLVFQNLLLFEVSNAVVGFDEAITEVNETAGTATVTLSRTGNLNSTVVVVAQTVDSGAGAGTATEGAGDDYIGTAETFVFGPGRTEATFDITINDDTNPDVTETLNLQLTESVGGIVFNEVLADPNGDANGDGTTSSTQDEFIEIVNNTEATVDLSGWTISDLIGVRHTFPVGTVLTSGQAVVVFSGGTPTGSFGGSVVQVAGSLGLNNSNETITLADETGVVIDVLSWGSEGGQNQALTRDPDITGSFVQHTVATGSGGAEFSPGTKIDGTVFQDGTIFPVGGGAGGNVDFSRNRSTVVIEENVARFAEGGTDIRIVSYNVVSDARPGMDLILEAIGEEVINGISRPIDILAVQEVTSQVGDTQAVLDVMETLYPGLYARGSVDGASQGGGTQGVIYNTSTLQLIEEVAIGTLATSGVGTGPPRQFLRYLFQPVGGDASDQFYVYNIHFRSADGSAPASDRADEAQQVRNDADALGEGAQIIYLGDLNLESAEEAAYQILVGAGVGQALDPEDPAGDWITNPSNGDWTDNANYLSLHTQAPATAATPGVPGNFATGGMNDRFEFIVHSGELIDGTGLEYRPDSVHVFGNNGSHPLDGAINDPGSTALPGLSNRTAVLDALTVVADHLPVVADYFIVDQLSTFENEGPASVSLTRTPGSDGTLTVSFATNDNTATLADNDYVDADQSVMFGTDEFSRDVPVTINDDSDIAESNEVIDLTIEQTIAAGQIQGIRINELRIDQPGSDSDEYVELVGDPNASFNTLYPGGLYYVVLGDGNALSGSGIIEEIVNLSGQSFDANGFFLLAESNSGNPLPGFPDVTPDMTAGLTFENDDNVTHFLVEGFSGSLGDDLDTDDDGILDVTPWNLTTGVVDAVAIVQQPFGAAPPSGTELVYDLFAEGSDGLTVGPEASSVMHVYRSLEGVGRFMVGSDELGVDDTLGSGRSNNDNGTLTILEDMDAIAFDLLSSEDRNLTSFTTDAPIFQSTGDGFGVFQRGTATTAATPGNPGPIPEVFLDQTSSLDSFDNFGIVTESNSDTFFGIADTVNPDNAGPLTATWEFDVSSFNGSLDLIFSLGAMGDFEAGEDSFTLTYQFDAGPVETAFATSVDESGSLTYTLADGDAVNFDDPLELVDAFGGATTLSNVLSSFRAHLAGSENASTLTIELTASFDGDDEAIVLQDVKVAPASFGVTRFSPTPSGFTAELNADLDIADVNLYDDYIGSFGSTDVILLGAGGDSSFADGNEVEVRGSLIVGSNLRDITFVATGELLPEDDYRVTFVSAANAFEDAATRILDGEPDGLSGGDFEAVFSIAPLTGPVVMMPDFVRGPAQAVDVPATSSGIPLLISDIDSVNSIEFDLLFDSSLLTLDPLQISSSIGTVTASTIAGGVNILVDGISTTGTNVEFATIENAIVPDNAPLQTKHVLDLANLSVNAGAVTATADDALHVVNYFGDLNVDRSLNSLDSLLLSLRNVQTQYSGFTSYPAVDPMLLANFNGDQNINALDSLLLSLRNVSGSAAVPQIPDLPSPLPTLVTGQDPRLSLPQVEAEAGQAVAVPLQIENTDPSAIELQTFDVAIQIDPEILSLVSVTPGSLAPDANIDYQFNSTAGVLLVSGVLPSPRTIEPGEIGELFVIDFVVLADAVAGQTSPLNILANAPSGEDELFTTSLNEGNLILIPEPTDDDTDAIDGLFTVIEPEETEPSQEPIDAAALTEVFADDDAPNALTKWSNKPWRDLVEVKTISKHPYPRPGRRQGWLGR